MSGNLAVVVDNDKPSAAITSLSNGQFVPAYKGAVNRALVIGGTASDPTSPISKVEVVGWGGDPTAEGTSNWTKVIGVFEGGNTIQVRAVDAVGNAGDLSAPVTIYGDATPPDFTYSQPADAVAATRTATGQWTIRLVGTAADPQYYGSPGSGVASVEAELVGPGTQGGWQKATLSGASWALDYRFPADVGDKSPTGAYDVIVRATDNVGNMSYQILYQRALLIDSAAPEVLLTATDTSTGALTTTIASAVTMGGVITETGVADLDALDASFAPLTQVVPFSGTLLQLDFEDRAGDRYFADSSGQFNNAGCFGSAATRCPAVAAGRSGQGLQFAANGTGALRVASSPALDFSTINPRSFSVGGWVKLGAETSNGFQLIQHSTARGGYSLGIADGRGLAAWTLRTDRGAAVQMSGAADLRDNRWHHLVGTFDRKAQVARLYVDGALVGSQPAPDATYGDYYYDKAPLAIGTPSRAATVDQVAVFGRALSAAEIAAVIASADRAWYLAALTQRGAGVANARWSLPVPAGLEGEYQLDLRTADTLGNRRLSGNAWRGMIDVVAPRVSFTGKATGQSYLDPATGARRYEVAYTCVAEDGYLAEKSFACPGNATQPPVHTYNADPIRKQLFPDSSQLIKLANTYTVWQESAQPAGSVTACDLFNHCTTTTAQAATASLLAADAAAGNEADVGAAVKRPNAVIVTPSDHAFVAATGQETVTVAAEAEGGLKAIELALDGAVVATLPFAREEGVTVAQHTFQVAVGGTGRHTLAARAIAWQGPDQKKPSAVQFTLDMEPPTVTLSNTVEGIGDTYVLGSGLLRFRGAANDDVELDAVQVRVGNGHFADAEFAGGEWHVAYPVADPEGKTLAVTVRATDRAGRISELTRDVLVDISEANPPDTAISAGPPNPSDEGAASFSFAGTAGEHEVAAYACQLDGGSFTPCASPQAYADLSKDEHTFRVRAIDSAGFVDPSPASVTWTVNPSQPDVMITGRPASPSASRAASFTFSGDGGAASFECALDGGAWTPCASPQAYTGLADGRHTFRVRAKDAAGNAGRADRFVWEVMDAAPVGASQALTTTMGLPVAITLGASDDDAVRFHIVRQPAHGALLGTAPNLVYEPDTGFVGGDSFSFSADDGDLFSNEATIRIDVQPKQQASYGLGSFVALAQEGVTIKAGGQVLSGSVAANDAGGSVHVGEDVAFHSVGSPPTPS